jgi:pimeloyl-ACP methyl ester carboxylesterase
VPFASLPSSPLAPGLTPVPLHYRELGSGPPLVFLHGGWGYEVYPFDRQEGLAAGRRILIPDRSGYGRSPRIEDLPVDFHRRAAGEMLGFLDALGIDRPVLWGHSDGAVIALWMAIAARGRAAALVLEACHYFRRKPRSREFFDTMARRPELLGERVCGVLAREHGDPYWRTLIERGGRAWLAIADQAERADSDLYAGRAPELALPVLVVHGASDPRTEPGELEALGRALPHARFALLEGAGHSPHSERQAADRCRRAVEAFLADLDA